MIFTKAKLILWGGRFLGVATFVGAIWVAGLNFGMDRGYNRAMDDYQEALDEYNKQWYNTVSERDEEWQAQINSTYRKLQQQVEQYRQVERREQELLAQLTVLESTLVDIRNEYENKDFGFCNVNIEFDRLLNDAYQAATTRPD